MKRTSLVVAVLVFVSVLFVGLILLPEARATTRYVGGGGPGNYTTIQSAINAASPGDTVYVYGGTYDENIVIDKTLSLRGENRDTTIIDGTIAGDVVNVTADWVNITGFNTTRGSIGIKLYYAEDCYVAHNIASDNSQAIYLLRSNRSIISHNNVSNNWDYGIYLDYSDNNTITDNIGADNWDYGIYLDHSDNNTITDFSSSYNDYGIALYSSENNVIMNNNLVGNGFGVYLSYSNNTTIANNDVSLDSQGIYLYHSSNNTMADNIALNNWYSIYLGYSPNNTLTNNTMVKSGVLIHRESLEYWNTHRIDATNTVNGKPVYYWKNTVGGRIPSGAGQVILANCTGVVVENQNVSNTVVGISLGFSSGNMISNNTATFNNKHGIYLDSSTENTIANNNLSSNTGGGAYLHINSNGNTIVNNTAVSNYWIGIYPYYSEGNIIADNNVSNNKIGIHVYHADNNTLSDNIVSSNRESGISFISCDNSTVVGNVVTLNGDRGVYMSRSHNNTVLRNTVSLNELYGIALYYSTKNRLSYNTVYSNKWIGIQLYKSITNTLRNNAIVKNGIYISGEVLEHWNTHIIDDTNTVNGKPVYYWKNATGGTIPRGAGEVILANCTGVLVKDQNLSDGTVGVLVGFSSGITIENNIASDNWYGMFFRDFSDTNITGNVASRNWRGMILALSSNNTISNNVVSSNAFEGIELSSDDNNVIVGNCVSNNRFGIRVSYSNGNTIVNNTASRNVRGVYLYSSINNRIYHNNFVENSQQAYDETDSGVWDNGYPSGGNYWSDYAGSDIYSGPNQNQPGSDGMGDNPYSIDASGVDRYPLMVPFGMSFPKPPMMLQASLSGKDLENVTLSWCLSPDDGMCLGTIVGYEVYRNMTYDPKGVGYGLVASIPNGTSTFIDDNSGEGNPNNYFYRICAVHVNDRTACAENQAGKFTRLLSQGPNLVSIPLIQSNESIERVLQTVKYDKAWFYDSYSQEWKWHMTFKRYRRDLWNINHTMGLWVNVTRESNLTVAGIVPAQTVIRLTAGWNLVSFPSFNTTYTVADLKAEIGATRVEGYDLAPPYYLRVLVDAEVLQAGYGYWVRVVADTIWNVEVS